MCVPSFCDTTMTNWVQAKLLSNVNMVMEKWHSTYRIKRRLQFLPLPEYSCNQEFLPVIDSFYYSVRTIAAQLYAGDFYEVT